jgi:hypothetical protein
VGVASSCGPDLSLRHRLVMQFLRRVVEQILQGIDLESPGSSTKWLETTRLGFRKTGDVAFWSPYTYQPFSAPPIFNVDAMLSLAKARMDATGDHADRYPLHVTSD